MSDLVEWYFEPEVEAPVLITGLSGWIDAGGAAATAIDHLLESTEAETVAVFDGERLIDHRARRPTMHLVDGVNEGLEWPTIELSVGADSRGRDVLVLHGAEPDHYWPTFVDLIVGAAQRLGTRMVIGLGAYPATVPHTRSVSLSATASTRELADHPDFLNASLDVPAGIQAAIEWATARVGIPSLGLWAQVPHYASGLPYPAGSVALLEALDRFASITVDVTALREQAIATRSRLDALVAGNPEHATMLAELEKEYDDAMRNRAELPTGDELADELQRFLREQDDE